MQPWFPNHHNPEPTPAWLGFRDRAVRRKSTSGASATGPVSRRATSAPSHRADEPPAPQAPGKQARLVHTARTDRSGRGARMRCPGASVLCLSPPLVALLLTRFAIPSGQSHPGFYTQPHQPGSGRRATVLARSDHSIATEEPAPSVALSPKSVHVIVWCRDTPVVLRSLDDRCERHKRASRAWSARWPASPKGASKVSHYARRSSEECVGLHASHRPNNSVLHSAAKRQLLPYAQEGNCGCCDRVGRRNGILKWLLKFINLFKAREIKTLFEGEPAPSTWGATTARCRVAESNYGVWWW